MAFKFVDFIKTRFAEKDLTSLQDACAGSFYPILKFLREQEDLNTEFDTRIDDSWISISDTWLYGTATTISVGLAGVGKFQFGDKIRLKQTGNVAYKYFYCVGVSGQIITITGGTSYTLVNAPITDIAISRQDNPYGFPHYFTYTPTYGAGGAMTYTTVNTFTFQFCIHGQTVHVIPYFLGTTGGVANGVITFTVPVNFATSTQQGSATRCLNTGVLATGYVFQSSATVAGVQLAAGVAWGLGASTGLTGEFSYRGA